MPRLATAALLLCLAACGIQAPPAVTRYVGTSTPTSDGPACRPSTSSLQLTNRHVIFVPDEGTWTVEGEATQSGTITAERDTRGADKKPYVTELTARYDATAVVGTYTTPRCTFRVQLTKV